MTNLLITVLAYVCDRVFGEFSFIKHPIIYIGELITYFERRFYKDTILRGLLLVLFVLFLPLFMATSIELISSRNSYSFTYPHLWTHRFDVHSTQYAQNCSSWCHDCR
ncbi:MAG: cobalamin biosynthesis protein [Sulfurimonas sp.]|nr:cobalamin biosynthesis protein [Sulfurimonas sp.]